MRTAKKTLCLVLVLAMMLSMCVFASADVTKADDYADAADIPAQYKQAATILTALEIFQGYAEDESFHGDNLLTRAQGAKILAVLMGYKDAMTPAEIVPNFDDMKEPAPYHWATPYVNYLADTGIIHGKSATVFDPEGPLTGTQFAKMLLTALGYDAEKEGLVGPGWDAKTVRLANSADSIVIPNEGVYGPFKYIENIDRYTAAQMAYMTLLLPLVRYDGDNKSWDFETSSDRTSQRISSRIDNKSNAYMVEFAERYFPGLVRTTQEADAFKTPQTLWTLNGEEILKGDCDAVFTDFDGANGKDVKDIVSKYTFGDSAFSANIAWEVYVDGVGETGTILTAVMDGDEDTDISDKGTLVQVYIDDEVYGNNAGYNGVAAARNVVVTVIIKHTFLAEATESYSAEDESLRLKVYTRETNENKGLMTEAEKGNISERTKGERVLVTMTDPYDLSATVKTEVQTVDDVDVSKDTTITGYKMNKPGTKLTVVKVDGENVDLAEMANTNSDILDGYDKEELEGYTYDIYFDPFGYVIGIEYNQTNTSYVFVTGFEIGSSYLKSSTFTANLIWTDGTMDENATVKAGSDDVKVLLDAFKTANANGDEKGSPTLNMWFTSSKDGDVISLDELVGGTGKKVQQSAFEQIRDGDGNYLTINNNKKANYSFAYSSDGVRADKVAYCDKGTVFILAGASDDVAGGAITKTNGTITDIKNANIKLSELAPDFPNFSYSTLDTVNGDTWANNYAADYGLRQDNSNVYFIYNDKGYVLYAVTVAEARGGNIVYITQRVTERDDVDAAYIDTYNAIVDGKATTVKVDSNKTSTRVNKLQNRNMYSVGYNDDGVIVQIDEFDLPDGSTQDEALVNIEKDNDDRGMDGYFRSGRLPRNTFSYDVKSNVLSFGDAYDDLDASKVRLNLPISDDCESFYIAKNDASAKGDYEFATSLDSIMSYIDEDDIKNITNVFAEVNSDGQATCVIILYGSDYIPQDLVDAANGSGPAVNEATLQFDEDTLTNGKLYITIENSANAGEIVETETTYDVATDAVVLSIDKSLQDDGVYVVGDDAAIVVNTKEDVEFTITIQPYPGESADVFNYYFNTTVKIDGVTYKANSRCIEITVKTSKLTAGSVNKLAFLVGNLIVE